MKTFKFPIYEFRPDKIFSGKLLRYNGGNWIDDDGEYDLAFICPQEQSYTYISLPDHFNIMWKWCRNMAWGLYVSKHPAGNAWHYMTKNGENWGNDLWDRDNHPNIKAGNSAGNKCCSLKGCASGGGRVEFNVIDETINAGLLRIANTKKIIKPPKIFKCCYCGEHDWRKEDNDNEIEL